MSRKVIRNATLAMQYGKKAPGADAVASDPYLDGILNMGRQREAVDNDDMVDMVRAGYVEVMVDHANKLWVNVDGKCMLRIGLCEDVTVNWDKTGGTKRVLHATMED